MSTADSYRSYAADCVRQAEGATSPVEKNVLLNVALAWIRLAHQKQAMASKAVAAPVDLDAVKETSADADEIDANTANAGVTRPAAAAQAAQPAG
jgi:hypothetical protein